MNKTYLYKLHLRIFLVTLLTKFNYIKTLIFKNTILLIEKIKRCVKEKLINNLFLYKHKIIASKGLITSSFNSLGDTIKIRDGLLLIDISNVEVSKIYLINGNSIKNRIFNFKIKLSDIVSHIKSCIKIKDI